MSKSDQVPSDSQSLADKPEQKNSLSVTPRHGSMETDGLTKTGRHAEIAGTAKGVRSLLQPWRQWVEERTNNDFEVVALDLDPKTPDGIREEIKAQISDFMRPAPRSEIAKGLARLKLITASAGLNQDDLTLQMAAYADELQRKPGFAVLWALSNWRGKFFPAFAEIEELVKEKSRYLESLSASLNVKQVARDTRQQWQKDRDEWAKTPRVTPEQVAEVMARLRVKPGPAQETPEGK